tara:strand:- start:36 stop:284 length:249 start_codon:yes stop_codon:yes gene_type:complete
MASSFVLINCTLGKEETVLESLRVTEGISTVSGVFGAYDIIVKVSADELHEMRELITKRIRKIEHIRSTLVLMIIDEQGDDQ